MKPWEKFLEKYRAFGQHPTRESHAALFDPAATILHPGMGEPMAMERYVDFIAQGLKRLPDFHLIPAHWAVNGDTVFVEARNTAVVRGQPIVWPATYVVTLRGEMVIRGHAYYDRTEVLSHFEPALTAHAPNAHVSVLEGASAHGSSASGSDDAYAAAVYERIVLPYAENWKHPDPEKFKDFYAPDSRMINPGFERPLGRSELAGYYNGLLTQIPDLRLQLERWAVAPGLLFTEWTVSGTIRGKRFALANTDRFSLRDLLAVEGVAYFDGLALRELTDPKLTRFAAMSFAGVASPDADARD